MIGVFEYDQLTGEVVQKTLTARYETRLLVGVRFTPQLAGAFDTTAGVEPVGDEDYSWILFF